MKWFLNYNIYKFSCTNRSSASYCVSSKNKIIYHRKLLLIIYKNDLCLHKEIVQKAITKNRLFSINFQLTLNKTNYFNYASFTK